MSHASVIVVTESPDEKAIAYQMEPFDEAGAWFADGSRWDWWQIGGRASGMLLGKDQLQRKGLDVDALVASRRADAERWWAKAQGESAGDRDFLYGIREGQTREQYVESHSVPLSAWAFLRNRHWNEAGRMGWFGMNTATECERSGPGEDVVGKCLYVHEESGARVVSWNADEDEWRRGFWRRFIDKLDPELWLTVVDYHV